MRDSLRRMVWVAGMPLRVALVWLIRGYRATIGRAMGGRCRFYPSCSEYAQAAIAQVGAIRGAALTVWRVLRCSPLSRGGVDYPPAGRRRMARTTGRQHAGPLYDSNIPPPAGLAADGSVAG